MIRSGSGAVRAILCVTACLTLAACEGGDQAAAPSAPAASTAPAQSPAAPADDAKTTATDAAPAAGRGEIREVEATLFIGDSPIVVLLPEDVEPAGQLMEVRLRPDGRYDYVSLLAN